MATEMETLYFANKEEMKRCFNEAIAEELLKDKYPNITQEEIQKISSLCTKNPFDAPILYEINNLHKTSNK